MKRCCLAARARVLHTLFGLCVLSPLAVSQDLTIQSSHTGTFLLGQTNAYYLLRVSNAGSSPSSGPVTVTENPPVVLTVTSMHGDGWTCSANSCNRNDALAGGATYPAIMVVATIAQGAGASLTNRATVSGGGDTNPANNSTSDVTALAANGYPIAWGWDGSRQAEVPPGLANIVSTAPGNGRVTALRSDGTVMAWGDNQAGPAAVPEGLTGIVAIAASDFLTLALKADGTVVAWGANADGQTDVPPGLSNVVAISAGDTFGLALKGDGTVVGWGNHTFGQTAVPAGLSNVVAISAGWVHGLALKSDGTVVTWGNQGAPGSVTVPAGLSDVVAISAGGYDSQALKKDGSVVIWGYDAMGSTEVPAGLVNVIAISTGGEHNLALKSDGTLVDWGSYYSAAGEKAVPDGLSGVIALKADSMFSLAILSSAPGTIPIKLDGAGLSLSIDGVESNNSPFVQDWIPGSAHMIGATSPTESGPGSQLVFTGWSDGGAVTHTVAPTVATTYIASLKRQYRLTTSSTAGGTISPPVSWVDSGASVRITATPNPGYVFTGFSGGLTGTANPRTLQMTAAVTVTANFALATSGGSCTYSVGPANLTFPTAGGTGFVTVTTQSGCAWTATSSPTWIAFTNPASGSGTGTVSVQIAANTGVTRSGTFTVAGQTVTVEQLGNTSFTTTSLFPHFAAGGGWNTRFIVLNTSASEITVRLNFLNDSGTPLALPLTFPQVPGTTSMVASTFECPFAVGATLVIDTASTGLLSQTVWVQVLSTGEVAGYDNFRLATGTGFREVFLPLQSAKASALILPFDHTGNYGTGIAVANGSTTSTSVRITLRNDGGDLMLSTTAQVPIQGHASFDLAGQYPVTAGLRGTIELEAPDSAGIGAIGLRYGANGEIAAVVPVVK